MPQVIQDAIRDVKDFPKPGIIFKDITPMLSDPVVFQRAVELLCETAQGQKIDKVVGIDARGFILGAPVALRLNAGFIPIRKQGKLPWHTYAESYALEYGEDTIEIHQDAIRPGDKVLLIDDLLATGGTAAAAVKLLQKLQADIISISFLIELTFLNGRKKISSNHIQSIINY